MVAIFEGGLLETGFLAGFEEIEFYATLVMELLTIACIPLALKLFSIRRIKERLMTEGASALRPYGMIRLILLTVPMFINTLLYYFFMSPSFAYMALLLLLSLAFVVPTKGRCEKEIGYGEEDDRR